MPHCESVPGVLFTDMDATLLDHDDYSFGPALPVLERLKKSGIPIVLCTSKTLAELLDWQQRLEITGPMIVENGGGVVLTGMDHLSNCFPEKLKGYPSITLGSPYWEIVEALARLARSLPGEIRGFGKMSIEEIVAATGLEFEEARLAAMRDFDEPFTWEPEPDDEDSNRLDTMARREGYMLTKGGRFYHLTGPSDKGRAVRWVMRNLFSVEGKAPPTIGLGDSDNDLGMLLAVDRGILVERPGGGHLVSRPAGVECAEGVGPRGWATAVTRWLDEIL